MAAWAPLGARALPLQVWLRLGLRRPGVWRGRRMAAWASLPAQVQVSPFRLLRVLLTPRAARRAVSLSRHAPMRPRVVVRPLQQETTRRLPLSPARWFRRARN